MTANSKILIVATAFWPSIGGYETFARLLAEGLAEDCDVEVVTDAPGPDMPDAPFRVSRGLSLRDLRARARFAEVIVINSMTLRYIARLTGFMRKAVLIHHTAYEETGSVKNAILEPVKRGLSAGVRLNICVSRFVSSRLFGRRVVITNGFDDRVFRRLPVDRGNRILFVGRLVREKGVESLVRSMVDVTRILPGWVLTIVGDGPLRDSLVRLRDDLALSSVVTFVGALPAPKIAEIMNSHRVLVVPSLREPFGIVALEALACGCRVAYANVGGLPEAVGDFGWPFEPSDESSMLDAISQAAGAVEMTATRGSELSDYLARCSRTAMIRRYQEVLAREIDMVGAVS